MQVTKAVADRILKQVNDLPNFEARTLAIDPDRAINELLAWLDIPVRVKWEGDRGRWEYVRINSEDPPEPVPVGWEQDASDAKDLPPGDNTIHFKDAIHRVVKVDAKDVPPIPTSRTTVLGS